MQQGKYQDSWRSLLLCKVGISDSFFLESEENLSLQPKLKGVFPKLFDLFSMNFVWLAVLIQISILVYVIIYESKSFMFIMKQHTNWRGEIDRHTYIYITRESDAQKSTNNLRNCPRWINTTRVCPLPTLVFLSVL